MRHPASLGRDMSGLRCLPRHQMPGSSGPDAPEGIALRAPGGARRLWAQPRSSGRCAMPPAGKEIAKPVRPALGDGLAGRDRCNEVCEGSARIPRNATPDIAGPMRVGAADDRVSGFRGQLLDPASVAGQPGDPRIESLEGIGPAFWPTPSERLEDRGRCGAPHREQRMGDDREPALVMDRSDRVAEAAARRYQRSQAETDDVTLAGRDLLANDQREAGVGSPSGELAGDVDPVVVGEADQVKTCGQQRREEGRRPARSSPVAGWVEVEIGPAERGGGHRGDGRRDQTHGQGGRPRRRRCSLRIDRTRRPRASMP